MNESDLQPVTSRSDRDQLFAKLAAARPPVFGLTSDHVHVEFELIVSAENRLSMRLLSKPDRDLRIREPIQLSFGLGEGQYFLTSEVENIQLGVIIIPAGLDRTLRFVQRRSNMRVPVEPSSKISYEVLMSSARPVSKRTLLNPLDLSAGGVRVVWPTWELGEPQLEQPLGGKLILGNKELELFGSIKTIQRENNTMKVGIGFHNLTVREEQTLFFFCLNMRRRLTRAA